MKRVFVISLCQNVESKVYPFIHNLKKIEENNDFNLYFIIGEDGSTDKTRMTLEKISFEMSNIRIFDTSFMSLEPERLKRMSLGREYLKHQLPSSTPNDLVLVIDMDLNLIHFDSHFFLEMVEELMTNDCFAVCSFSTPLFYDLLSLKYFSKKINLSLLQYKLRLISNKNTIFWLILGLPRFFIKLTSFYEGRLIGSGRGQLFLSAFNGCCLYEREIYDNFSYFSDNIECEHVTLHTQMHNARGGGVLVSNNIAVEAPTEHMKSPLQILWRKFGMAINSHSFF